MLLDIRLKDGDGLALLEELRHEVPQVPIIMATAYGDSDRTIAAMKAGAFEYVTKPFDLDALLATLRRAVKAPRGARARRDERGDVRRVKLLRVLEDGAYERVGGAERLQTNARIVAATSRAVVPGTPGATLREDLFYRLGVVHIEVPPLRERRQDIPLLVESFLRRAPGPRRAVSEAAMDRLTFHSWPGNVRQLLHVLENACVMSTAEVLDEADFDLPVEASSERPGAAGDLDLRRALDQLEKSFIERALERAKGNRAEAARLLGIRRALLYARMKQLGVVRGEPRS